MRFLYISSGTKPPKPWLMASLSSLPSLVCLPSMTECIKPFPSSVRPSLPVSSTASLVAEESKAITTGWCGCAREVLCERFPLLAQELFRRAEVAQARLELDAVGEDGNDRIMQIVDREQIGR